MLFYNIQYYSITSKTIYKLSNIAYKFILCEEYNILVNKFCDKKLQVNLFFLSKYIIIKNNKRIKEQTYIKKLFLFILTAKKHSKRVPFFIYYKN